MGNGIFAPMFDPAVEQYADDVIDEQRRGKTRVEATATAEKRISQTTSVVQEEEELLVDRFVRELPEVKRRLLRGFRADVTEPIKKRILHGVDRTERQAVRFAAMVAQQVYETDLNKREALARLGRKEPIGPVHFVLHDKAKAQAVNGIYHKYEKQIRRAFNRLRGIEESG